MSVSSSRAKLQEASKLLLGRWRSTKAYWRDQPSRQFEEKHIELIMRKMREADKALSELERLLNVARRDCE
jgi:hypothetical protein